MKILIVSDAWQPQTNGVVRTLEATCAVLRQMGHEVQIIGPRTLPFWTVPLPSYPEIDLVFGARRLLGQAMASFQPEAVHIATEGPLGWAARGLCVARHYPFTTAYHTHFPAYVAARVPSFLKTGAEALVWRIIRHFHKPSRAVLAPTPSLVRALRERGLAKAQLWTRGVDTGLFRPSAPPPELYEKMARPLLLYVGRVAVEKNLPAFLALRTPGTKVIVGDGPALVSLKAAYPEAVFVGAASGETLAAYYAGADLFVFPSKTDTLGLVLLEAAASGLRIAAYPVSGPADVFASGEASSFAVMDADLGQAIATALLLPKDPEKPRSFALARDWQAASVQFLTYLMEK